MWNLNVPGLSVRSLWVVSLFFPKHQSWGSFMSRSHGRWTPPSSCMETSVRFSQTHNHLRIHTCQAESLLVTAVLMWSWSREDMWCLHALLAVFQSISKDIGEGGWDEPERSSTYVRESCCPSRPRRCQIHETPAVFGGVASFDDAAWFALLNRAFLLSPWEKDCSSLTGISTRSDLHRHRGWLCSSERYCPHSSSIHVDSCWLAIKLPCSKAQVRCSQEKTHYWGCPHVRMDFAT